jgi:hypothetical protein
VIIDIDDMRCDAYIPSMRSYDDTFLIWDNELYSIELYHGFPKILGGLLFSLEYCILFFGEVYN